MFHDLDESVGAGILINFKQIFLVYCQHYCKIWRIEITATGGGHGAQPVEDPFTSPMYAQYFRIKTKLVRVCLPGTAGFSNRCFNGSILAWLGRLACSGRSLLWWPRRAQRHGFPFTSAPASTSCQLPHHSLSYTSLASQNDTAYCRRRFHSQRPTFFFCLLMAQRPTYCWNCRPKSKRFHMRVDDVAIGIWAGGWDWRVT